MFSASGSSGFGALSKAWMLYCKRACIWLSAAAGNPQTSRHSPEQDGANLQSRRPLVLQDVQTDATQLSGREQGVACESPHLATSMAFSAKVLAYLVDVGVVDFGQEANLGGAEQQLW